MEKESNEKKLVETNELEDVNGGRISPTWIPVDESCCECNCGSECAFPQVKGRYDNCGNCRHFN